MPCRICLNEASDVIFDVIFVWDAIIKRSLFHTILRSFYVFWKRPTRIIHVLIGAPSSYVMLHKILEVYLKNEYRNKGVTYET